MAGHGSAPLPEKLARWVRNLTSPAPDVTIDNAQAALTREEFAAVMDAVMAIKEARRAQLACQHARQAMRRRCPGAGGGCFAPAALVGCVRNAVRTVQGARIAGFRCSPEVDATRAPPVLYCRSRKLLGRWCPERRRRRHANVSR